MAEHPHPEPDRDHDHRPDPAATAPASTPPEDPDELAADPSSTRAAPRPEDEKIDDETAVRSRGTETVRPKLN